MRDQQGGRRGDVILLTPVDASQEERWRIAMNGGQRLMMVAVGRWRMMAWKVMTSGWGLEGCCRLMVRTTKQEGQWGSTTTACSTQPLPPPPPPHPRQWHLDNGGVYQL
jgi:hypothetical protein